MRILGLISAFVFVLAVIAGINPGQVSAIRQPKHNTQLQVTGIVLPAQHVIVDEQGKIIKILSNTNKDVVPKFYVSEISKETMFKPTSGQLEKYRQLVPKGTANVGTIYEYVPGRFEFNPLGALQANKRPQLKIVNPIFD